MAIAFGTASFAPVPSGTSATPADPASAASGDIFIGFCLTDATATNLLRPSGWTNLFNGTTGAGGMDYDISWILRGGSAPSRNWTWTGSNYGEAYILRFTGVDTSTPIDAQATLVTGTGAPGTTRVASAINPGAVVAATTNTMAVAIAGHWTGSATTPWTQPTGYTMRSDNTVGNDGMMATKALVSAGSEDPDQFFCSGTSTNNQWFAVTITLKQAAAGGGAAQQFLTMLGVG